jgi:hypothetical protein
MSSERNVIAELMAIFDMVDSSLREIDLSDSRCEWHPRDDREKAAFNALTNRENRQALKAWYAGVLSISPLADAFRKILERAIGDDLPIGKR